MYGPPGTGKTELALTLAEAAGIALFTVQASDEDEDPLNARQRLSRYSLAQHLLTRRHECALLFDEAGVSRVPRSSRSITETDILQARCAWCSRSVGRCKNKDILAA